MPPSTTPRKSTTGKRRTRPTASETPAQATAQPIPVPEEPGAKYAPDAWLSGGIGGTTDLQVPSGQLCLVRRPGVQGLMQAGVLRNMDSLSSLVSEKHLKGGKKGKKGAEQVDIKSIMEDPTMLNNVMHTVDRVVTHCVVKPEVVMAPNDVTRRKAGVVYADMIDLVDKMFIFNYVVGGSADLDSFRGELDRAVGSLEAEQGVRAAPE